jgi:hypothetical protein
VGAFAQDGDDIHVLPYTPTSRPDGHGIWIDGARSVPFFLEFDTGTERPLSRLADKIDGYLDLARVTGRVWLVLFWLPSQTREWHLHQHLSQAGIRYPKFAQWYDWWAARDSNPAPTESRQCGFVSRIR